jgi:hypothetical protein
MNTLNVVKMENNNKLVLYPLWFIYKYHPVQKFIYLTIYRTLKEMENLQSKAEPKMRRLRSRLGFHCLIQIHYFQSLSCIDVTK